MAVWLARAGRYGQDEDLALSKNLAIIGWEDLPDLTEVKTREELEAVVRQTFPDAKPKTVANWIGQLWAFRNRIQIDDLAVLPMKSQAAIAVGRVTGPYQYRSDLGIGPRHTRPVQWLRKDIPRSAFDQDILYSFGAFMAVCQIQRNDAEARIRAVLEGHPVPSSSPTPVEPETGQDTALENLEEYSQDQILKAVGRKFRGHDLARLVNEVLKAQGYQTQLSPVGPDGGVDIVAGRGPMGFDPPRLCVQVKSSDDPVDVKVLRELQGVMQNVSAEQGLLVAWGGFRQSVVAEARRLFFNLRLWDSGDLVREVLAYYEQLPKDLQAELPLKRIWALVPEE